MSLLSAIQEKKKSLKQTVISVVHEDGSVVEESRNSDGGFSRIEEEEPGISKRRQKKVDRIRRMGFVIDLKPDLQIAKCCEGIYLGSQDAARELSSLRENGITHIVNAATGIPNFFPTHFVYKNIEVLDIPSERLIDRFEEIHNFMSIAIAHNGRVFVHCNAGISRSSTFVISYIMKIYDISLAAALLQVREARSVVKPNDGFMQQLLMFEDGLQIEKNQLKT